MLQSVLISLSEVKQILVQKNQLGRAIGLNEDVIREVLDFLVCFKECSDLFQGDKKPTICNIALCYQKLWRHIQVQATDSLEMILLKGQAILCFEEYCALGSMEYIACMLNPK